MATVKLPWEQALAAFIDGRRSVSGSSGERWYTLRLRNNLWLCHDHAGVLCGPLNELHVAVSANEIDYVNQITNALNLPLIFRPWNSSTVYVSTPWTTHRLATGAWYRVADLLNPLLTDIVKSDVS